MAIERDMKLLTASDVAQLCEVDLKTIHNWVERGCIPHFRTPGRHLRFQATDVAKFLRDWGYAIPRRFYREIAHTIVVVGGKEAAAHVARAAGPTTSVHTVDDLYAALLHIGAEPTSAVVIDAQLVKTHAAMIGPALAAIARAFSTMPLVLLGDDEHHLAESHELTVVAVNDAKGLRAALTGDAGETESAEAPSEPGRLKRKVRSAGDE